eukprot:1190620-Prorocentrum_minimum.AAC.1
MARSFCVKKLLELFLIGHRGPCPAGVWGVLPLYHYSPTRRIIAQYETLSTSQNYNNYYRLLKRNTLGLSPVLPRGHKLHQRAVGPPQAAVHLKSPEHFWSPVPPRGDEVLDRTVGSPQAAVHLKSPEHGQEDYHVHRARKARACDDHTSLTIEPYLSKRIEGRVT